jgi:DNA-3-methyladenine glycosylase
MGRAERPIPDHRLASGPALVCAAFDLDRSLTGRDLLDPSAAIRIEARPAGERPPRVVAGARIGIGYAGEPWVSRPWRIAIAGHPSVSRPPIGAEAAAEHLLDPASGETLAADGSGPDGDTTTRG